MPRVSGHYRKGEFSVNVGDELDDNPKRNGLVTAVGIGFIGFYRLAYMAIFITCLVLFATNKDNDDHTFGSFRPYEPINGTLVTNYADNATYVQEAFKVDVWNSGLIMTPIISGIHMLPLFLGIIMLVVKKCKNEEAPFRSIFTSTGGWFNYVNSFADAGILFLFQDVCAVYDPWSVTCEALLWMLSSALTRQISFQKLRNWNAGRTVLAIIVTGAFAIPIVHFSINFHTRTSPSMIRTMVVWTVFAALIARGFSNRFLHITKMNTPENEDGEDITRKDPLRHTFGDFLNQTCNLIVVVMTCLIVPLTDFLRTKDDILTSMY